MFRFNKFARDQRGATAIEYGLIAALVSIAAITALQTLGTTLETTFDSIEQAISASSS